MDMVAADMVEASVVVVAAAVAIRPLATYDEDCEVYDKG